MISKLECQIQSFPSGYLTYTTNGVYTKWFINQRKQRTYIPKKDRHLAEILAVKKYYSYQLEELKREKILIDSCLNNPDYQFSNANSMLSDNSRFSPLIKSHIQSVPDALQCWTTEPYEHNPNYTEQLIYKNISGNILRSKSELMIDTALFMHKIPYRYECALHLGDATFYPDFTLRNLRTGNKLYWEHFGMMDDEIYSRKAYSKLQIYNDNGIIPTHNLIVTLETKNLPLTPDKINSIIKEYLL